LVGASACAEAHPRSKQTIKFRVVIIPVDLSSTVAEYDEEIE